MKRFAFIAGNKADPTPGMRIDVLRSGAPLDMKLGMWLDDDGKTFPKLTAERLARTGVKASMASCGEFVLLDRARIRAKLCGFDGVLTVEPGTRFDAGAGETVVAQVDGGRIGVREGRRFAELEGAVSTLNFERKANDTQVLTLEAEKPPGAQPGQRYRVDVVQRRPDGSIVGGLAVVFTFD